MNRYSRSRSRNSLKGLTILEFTLTVLVSMLLVLSAFEFGRYVYSMQMLNEMTRKAARLAAVCSIGDRDDIKDLAEIVENRPYGFTADDLEIAYLDRDGSEVTVDGYSSMSTDDKDDVLSQVRYVQAFVSDDYKFQFVRFLSFLGDAGSIKVPNYQTVIPAESLGVVRPTQSSPSGATEDC